MHSALEQLLSKVRAKATAILRVRANYSVPELVNQFKTHVWGLIVSNNGGYFHAASALLAGLDQAQNRFLCELGLTPEQAFLEFYFASPGLRRHIGVLGSLHKRVLGKWPPSFERLLPWYSSHFSNPRGMGHSKQLYGHNCEVSAHPALYARSIFAMVVIYNNLPQSLVDAASVQSFQSGLTQIARTRCQQGVVDWALTFCRRRSAVSQGSASIVLD